MSEEKNRWGSQREYLQTGQTIRLSPGKDGKNGKTWQILSVLGEGASAVCYEAVCADDEGEMLGVLKEFYPVSTRSGDRVWSNSMKRQASGQLVPLGASIRIFAALREAYIDAYRKLQLCVRAGRDGGAPNKILNNYIQDARILYGCLDSGEAALPSVYIWSRALHGVSFEQYLDEVRKEPGEESDKKLLDILETVHTVADSVKAIHEAGLLHLDIKPSNFLVLYDSSHRLMPNHISLFDIDTMHPVGSDFPVRGTEGYAAPEVRRGETALCWADIYSIGAMLFHAVVMMEPGSGELSDNRYQDRYYKNIGYYVSHSQLIRGEQSNSDVHMMALLVRILRKCLAYRWEDRYGSCEELLGDLEKAIGRLRLYTLPAGALGQDEQMRVISKAVDTGIVMQKLLYRYPVQEHVLVVGAGTYGQKFIDQCLQAGQSKDTFLKIRALSDTPEEDAAMYLQFRPALTDFTRVTVDGDRVDTAADGSVTSRRRLVRDRSVQEGAVRERLGSVTPGPERLGWVRSGREQFGFEMSEREGLSQELSGSKKAEPERPGQERLVPKKVGPERPGQERLVPERPGKRENGVCCAQIDVESFVIAETNEDSRALNQILIRALLNPTVRYDCVFIALGEDARNRSIAELFAKEFACKGISCPVCYVCEREPENLQDSKCVSPQGSENGRLWNSKDGNLRCRSTENGRLWGSKGESLRKLQDGNPVGTADGSLWGMEHGNLHPVWVNEPLTPGQISPSLERMAFQTHLCWDRSPNRDISDIYEKFIQDKYNYASSM
ncbi:MAG: hypothetical protein LUF30_01695, partial [Lachnospiraceae bacterium]|nr:hypothetical protein [Lachnospiraceae bacterium]